MTLIEKLPKFKKGEKINIKGENYIVENFSETYHNDDERVISIELIKEGEKPEEIKTKEQLRKHLSGYQKYVLSYNEKTGERKFYKLIKEKEIFPKGFQIRSKISFYHYKEIK